MNEVTVIGAGIAGTAAALELARVIAADGVTVIVGPAGATQLGPGVFDGSPDDDARNVLGALGASAYALGDCAVATLAGIVRTGTGRDRALLDLGALEGEVLVPRSTRQGWDADALARTLSASPFARERGLAFRAFDASLVRYADERFLPDAAIAARHDDAERAQWLVERLRIALAAAHASGEARTKIAGVLLPPWLGATHQRASALTAELGVPCGEIVVGLAGPAGFRFAAARDRAFAEARVRTIAGFVHGVVEGTDSVVIELEHGAKIETRACVLATGGLVGGGLRYEPSDAMESAEYPLEARPYARASIADVPVGVRGRLLGAPGSLFGVAPEAIAWPFVENADLERVGVLVEDDGGVRDSKRLFACGELVADRVRSWFEAARSGAIAARSAGASASAHVDAGLRLSADAADRARSSG